MFARVLAKLFGGKGMPTVAVGQIAPPLELAGVDGKKYSLQAALAQGPVLAVFFKVSCPTCQYTFPFLERLHQQFRTTPVQIWGISQDNARDTQQFTREFGVTFPILIDADPYAASLEYGLKYVPTMFLVSSEGQVELSGDGFCKVDLLEVQKWVAKRLSVTPGELFTPGERVPEYKPG